MLQGFLGKTEGVSRDINYRRKALLIIKLCHQFTLGFASLVGESEFMSENSSLQGFLNFLVSDVGGLCWTILVEFSVLSNVTLSVHVQSFWP